MKGRMISAQILDDWCLQYKPSGLTILNLKTGQQLQEPSLVAAKYRLKERTGTDRATGETRTFSFKVLDRYLAAGEEARAYVDTPDVMVFSPFRDGQVAQYGDAEYLFRELIWRVSPRIRILKPVLCIKVQEHTTDVEERAIVDLGIQAGARKVFLYQEPLSVILDHRDSFREMRNAIVVDIQPQKEF